MERGRGDESDGNRPKPPVPLAYYRVTVQEPSGGMRTFIVAAADPHEVGRLVRQFGTPEVIEPRTAPRTGSGLPRIISEVSGQRSRAASPDMRSIGLRPGRAGEATPGPIPRTIGRHPSTAESRDAQSPPSRRAATAYDEVLETDLENGAGGFSEVSKAVRSMRPGGLLQTPRLDALGCSVRELSELLEVCIEREIALRSVAEELDTRNEPGQAFVRLVFHLADMERKVQSNRTRMGLSAAGRHGRKGGRPPRLTDDDIATARQLLEAPGASLAGVAARIGVSRSTLYRALTGSSRSKAAEETPGRASATGEP